MLEPESRLPVSFLRSYRQPRVPRASVEVPVTMWTGATLTPPTVSYHDVMRSDAGVAQWLGRTAQFGFCLVTGTPPTDHLRSRESADTRTCVDTGVWLVDAQDLLMGVRT